MCSNSPAVELYSPDEALEYWLFSKIAQASGTCFDYNTVVLGQSAGLSKGVCLYATADRVPEASICDPPPRNESLGTSLTCELVTAVNSWRRRNGQF